MPGGLLCLAVVLIFLARVDDASIGRMGEQAATEIAGLRGVHPNPRHRLAERHDDLAGGRIVCNAEFDLSLVVFRQLPFRESARRTEPALYVRENALQLWGNYFVTVVHLVLLVSQCAKAADGVHNLCDVRIRRQRLDRVVYIRQSRSQHVALCD
jgi:hypothetical protein